MADYYTSQEKTPLPTAAELFAPRLGASHMTEVLRDACTCGRPVGQLAFDIAMITARHDDIEERNAAVLAFLYSIRAKMCCRNIVMAPLATAVVCADVGAVFVAPGAEQFVSARTANAPAASTKTATIVPPMILAHVAAGGSIGDVRPADA